MAWKKQFRCKQCGYEADVYEGRGFMGQHISTMTCPDCHSLQPLVVGGVIGDAAPSFRSEVGRLCLQVWIRPHPYLGRPYLPLLWRQDGGDRTTGFLDLTRIWGSANA